MEIKEEDFNRLRDYFRFTGEPDIRKKRRGDKKLYVGAPLNFEDCCNSDEWCLYSKRVHLELEYHEQSARNSAAEATMMVQALIPDNIFYVNNKIAGKLKYDLYDPWFMGCTKAYYTETIIFPSLFEVSLLQQYFDDHEINYLIFSLYDDKWQSQHDDVPLKAEERFEVKGSQFVIVARNMPLATMVERDINGRYRISVGSYIGAGGWPRVVSVEEAAAYIKRLGDLNKLIPQFRQLGWDDVLEILTS